MLSIQDKVWEYIWKVSLILCVNFKFQCEILSLLFYISRLILMFIYWSWYLKHLWGYNVIISLKLNFNYALYCYIWCISFTGKECGYKLRLKFNVNFYCNIRNYVLSFRLNYKVLGEVLWLGLRIMFKDNIWMYVLIFDFVQGLWVRFMFMP
jgi:hypothetical protein